MEMDEKIKLINLESIVNGGCYMKKRIMHIAQSAGGVERYIKMLLENTDSSKYDNILVCSLEYKKEDYEELVFGFEYVDMIRSINIISDFKAVLEIRKIIKKYNPDVVYMHSSKAGALGRVANLTINNLSIYNPHGWAFNIDTGNLHKRVYAFIEKILSNFCDVIIAISDFEKESAISSNICKAEKIKVIYNGIDINDYNKKKDKFSITREKLNIPSNAYVIGTTGRLSKQKAPDIFIKAAAIIKENISNAYFVLVGDGEDHNEIIKLIDKYNLKNDVLITGWVEDPMDYLQIFDQAMLLSRWEGFGLVLAEYMLAKKPIIATNVDAIPNIIIDRYNGLLVKKDDLNSIVDASIEINSNIELSKDLIENGYKIVNNKFNIDRVINEFYKELIDKIVK